MEGLDLDRVETIEQKKEATREEKLRAFQETLAPLYQERLSEENVLRQMSENGHSFLPPAERN